MNQLLYVLGSTNRVGLYKIYSANIEEIAILDSEYVKNWDLVAGEGWEPVRLNAHFSLKNFLFVELAKSIIVITIEDDHRPVFVNQILGDSKNGYRGFLSPRSYVIVSGNNSGIIEYSLNDITNIKRTNTFQKFNFSYSKDISRGVVIGNFSHNLYVLGSATYHGQPSPALLIYKTQENNFEQLYSVVGLPGIILS